MATTPDPHRVGGLAWAERTRGRLTRAERRHLLGEIVRGQGDYLATRVRRVTGRVPKGARGLSFGDFRPPDSAFARLAEEAADEQGPAVRGHGSRTWAFGTALALLDGEQPDPEVFYAASLLHDYGVEHVIPGEDFVIRSAARAALLTDDADLAATVGDAITVHCTAGLTVAKDGAAGFYVMSGAGLDLAGLRVGDLPSSYLDEVHVAHPRHHAGAVFRQLISDEAAANPDGRFAQLKRCGFNVLVRVNPID